MWKFTREPPPATGHPIASIHGGLWLIRGAYVVGRLRHHYRHTPASIWLSLAMLVFFHHQRAGGRQTHIRLVEEPCRSTHPRQQLFDIGNLALLAKVLCEISYDEVDALRNRGINSIADRIEAVNQAAHRNVVLIEELLAAISLGLEEADGGAQ